LLSLEYTIYQFIDDLIFGIIRLQAEQEEGESLKKAQGIHRTNDYLFKRIFSTEEVLLGFLNDVFDLPAGKELTRVKLDDREMDPKYQLDRGARLDILAETEDGMLINIEVQVANEYDIPKRTLYYWSGLYHDQLTEGKKFKDLHKAVTINILDFIWFNTDNERYHRTFHAREDSTGELLNEDMEIHFLEKKKVTDIAPEPEDPLKSWMLFLNNVEGEAMEAIAVDNPPIKKAMTVEDAFMRNKQERRIYELREKARLDEISAMEGAEARGEARGEAQGEARGEARGKVTASQDAICEYLDARFESKSRGLQKQVKQIDQLELLDKIIKQIFTVSSLEEAKTVISEAIQRK
jgi:predicted transposase/invertase (TIGR01784 family)